MTDDLEPRDLWLASRLEAAARDAHAAPRKRLLLTPTPPQGRRRWAAWLRGHRLVVTLVALNAATGAVVIALGLSISSRGAQTVSPSTPAQPVDPPATVNGGLRLDFTMRDTGVPPVVAFGSVWVANPDAGSVERIDERTLQVTASVSVDTAGSGRPTGLASDGASIWATSLSRGGVVRIDPASNRVVDTIAVDGRPQAVAASGGTLWVTTAPAPHVAGTLLEIDAAGHRLVRSAAVGSGPGTVAVAAGAVWVANSSDGTVSRLDTASWQVTTTKPNPADYDFGYVAVVADSGGAWAVDNDRSVLERIDGETMTPSHAVGVGVGLARTTATSGVGPTGVALDGGSAWVVSAAQLVEVDLGTGRARAMDLPLGSSVAVGDGAVWVLAGDRTQAQLVKLTPRVR